MRPREPPDLHMDSAKRHIYAFFSPEKAGGPRAVEIDIGHRTRAFSTQGALI